YPATCSNCGKPTDAPFEPDSSRPVYCPECYKIMMNKKHQEEKMTIEKKEKVPAFENKKVIDEVAEKIIEKKEMPPTPTRISAPTEQTVKPGQNIVFDN
ncbi:MAG: CxxC-x17-CxxC domain-containing protein, partial [Patescibacteria group bacterium]